MTNKKIISQMIECYVSTKEDSTFDILFNKMVKFVSRINNITEVDVWVYDYDEDSKSLEIDVRYNEANDDYTTIRFSDDNGEKNLEIEDVRGTFISHSSQDYEFPIPFCKDVFNFIQTDDEYLEQRKVYKIEKYINKNGKTSNISMREIVDIYLEHKIDNTFDIEFYKIVKFIARLKNIDNVEIFIDHWLEDCKYLQMSFNYGSNDYLIVRFSEDFKIVTFMIEGCGQTFFPKDNETFIPFCTRIINFMHYDKNCLKVKTQLSRLTRRNTPILNEND